MESRRRIESPRTAMPEPYDLNLNPNLTVFLEGLGFRSLSLGFRAVLPS